MVFRRKLRPLGKHLSLSRGMCAVAGPEQPVRFVFQAVEHAVSRGIRREVPDIVQIDVRLNPGPDFRVRPFALYLLDDFLRGE